MERTKHPAVLIHGLFGWGKQTPFYNWGPNYWPIKDLDAVNPNYVLVEVGVASSDHDRACEVFYQLMGGRVDYGKAHAAEKKHARYGKTYATALHPTWSAANPVHLFGHSYGATTALELYQLICADFFKVGSDYTWVKSIVSIAGPLSGATMSHMCGLQDDLTIEAGSINHLISIAVSTLWKFQQVFPFLENVYPIRMPQWLAYCRWSTIFSVNNMPLKTGDSAFDCLLPAYRFARNSQLVHMDKVHLMSIVSKDDETTSLHIIDVAGLLLIALLWRRREKHKWLLGLVAVVMLQRLRSVDIAKLPFFLTHILRWHATTTSKPIYEGFEKDKWAANDGVVNTYSMLCPRYCETYPAQSSVPKQDLARIPSHVSIDMSDPVQVLPTGMWHVYRVAKNHFCGTAGDRDAKELYTKLFRLLNMAK
ncbi:hypothetical protein SPRG_19770 [Saprolegnia parasitica CBS 223.65]|uniref:Lipase-like C-terminal domain-containing protein n=1 Tax=Saprolegnia parasitica (strain CBS 223.65) TaxID=695850 RepID=A0A067CHM2_SAPPC|nr:hypothetical protein SPRG_19770 [Saprolegnia parasitica CBS 223.65]KDO30209.1 hypothetical protein SPRG_19770 [Saprolegnia parasitica CBS 223.65]|eukprot:XP_012199025.1 hypothetical protein SPRG_19770 [Saprolegnia parasitica CBS 223.65]